jgi:hypothetical protein
MATAPLTRPQLVSMRQSVAATRSLPAGQIEQLIDELDWLMSERAKVVAVMSELSAGPWPEMRRLLNDLTRTVTPT